MEIFIVIYIGESITVKYRNISQVSSGGGSSTKWTADIEFIWFSGFASVYGTFVFVATGTTGARRIGDTCTASLGESETPEDG